MFAYITKRLLLMIPTLVGVMLITFAVTQFVPGGPVEQLVSQLEGRSAQGEASTGAGGLYRGAHGLDQELERLAVAVALGDGGDVAPEVELEVVGFAEVAECLGDGFLQGGL